MKALVVVAALALAAPAGAAAPARIIVGAKEFQLTLSRASIKAGPAAIQLVNYGEDAHDLRLRRVGGTRTYRIGTVAPGDFRELDAKLLPGRYKLWCSLANHAALGMHSTLVVSG